MKKLSKFSFLFIILSFVISNTVLAIEDVSKDAPKKATLLATVSVHNAKIISQEENKIKISFDIANREGAQSGVRYGVKLAKEIDKKLSIIDEYVYPEILSLSTNTTINKTIEYTAPSNLDGDYIVIVSVKNYSGLPLGSSKVSSVRLISSLDTVEIIQNTCSVSILGSKSSEKKTIDKPLDLSGSDKINLTCNVINNKKTEVSISPVYETYMRTTYSEKVEQVGGDTNSINFKPGETKTVSISLPKGTIPQFYSVKVSFKEGDTFSNSIFVYYRIEGSFATIQNFSLDKDYYKNKEDAKISFFFSSLSLSDGKITNPVVSLVATITNKRGKNCIAPINKTLTESGLVEIPVTMISNCSDPKTLIELRDENGNILDQKELVFKSKEPSLNSMSKIILLIFGILVVAGIIIYLSNLKKKQNEIVKI